VDRARGARARGAARRRRPAPDREDGGGLSVPRAALAAACCLLVFGPACTNLTTDLTRPVAIEFVTQASPFVEVNDTLPLVVRVLDRAGDSIPGAPVSLLVLDTAALGLDSAHQAVFGRAPATSARVVAVSGSLRSDPLSLRVPAGHADSLAVSGPSALSVGATDSLSGSLTVTVLDLTTTPGTAAPLTARPVRFAIVQPAYPSRDSAAALLRSDSLGQTVVTAADGTAAATLKRKSGASWPDSLIVEASVRRSSGVALRGSPVRFVVRVQ
jgi:hypothetical protein